MAFGARIGAMRETLTIQRSTIAPDSGGFQTTTSGDPWSTLDTVAGEYIQPDSGSEAFQGEAVTATLPIVFRVRYRADIEPKQRVLWLNQASRVLQIHAVIQVQQVGPRFLLLHCGLTQ